MASPQLSPRRAPLESSVPTPGGVEDDGTRLQGDGYLPQPDARVGDLALECWNLRKTVLDLNSQSLKHQNDMKTQKNLLKNLQRLVHDVQEENKARTRESLGLKGKCTDLEKKLSETNSNNTMLTNNLNRYKKIMGSMQSRVVLLEKERKQLETSRDELVNKMREDHSTVESALRTELKAAQTELHRLTTENQSLKVMLNDSTDKSNQLVELSEQLQHQVQGLQLKCANVSEFMNHELEMAYDQLHSKMERIWNERVEAGKELWRREFEHQQLMAFILSEGLQLPDFPPPSSPPPPFAFLDS